MDAIFLLWLWLPLGSLDTPVSLDDLRVFPARADAVMVTAQTLKIHQGYCSPPVFFSREEWEHWESDKKQAYFAWYVWDDVRLAYDDKTPVETRLMVLRRLRDWIGWNAYYNGLLPDPVPFWRVYD